jgi:hypothetical protein
MPARHGDRRALPPLPAPSTVPEPFRCATNLAMILASVLALLIFVSVAVASSPFPSAHTRPPWLRHARARPRARARLLPPARARRTLTTPFRALCRTAGTPPLLLYMVAVAVLLLRCDTLPWPATHQARRGQAVAPAAQVAARTPADPTPHPFSPAHQEHEASPTFVTGAVRRRGSLHRS